MASDLSTLVANLSFVDELYASYVKDPASVDPSWRRIFSNGVLAQTAAAPTNGAAAQAAVAQQVRVYELVNAYRSRGHLVADLDPLENVPRVPHPELDPRDYGFTDADLDRVVPPGGFYGTGPLPLRDLIYRLRETYCRHLAVELMHISSPERRAFLEERMEPALNRIQLDPATQMHILDRLAAAEIFESFVHTKYVGTKRFSLEGGDSLIPLVDLVLQHAGDQGVEEVVIGMAHRGRLNVLANIMGKSASDIFTEFEDVDPQSALGGGDVKYHLGYSTDHVTRSGKKLHLSLAFNPSHLEAVDPVVMGRVRAKQRRRRDWDHTRVLPILVHGDAAFAGQGLVAETLNLSQLHGYRVGGTVHVIVNNQIGFTTAPAASRSTPYSTDVAKMIQVPIFHVNGDHPEAVAQAVKLAMEYRDRYHCDVVIDMFCFRKYGHNEGDEPSFTQPLLYQKIERHPSVRALYAKELIAAGVATEASVDAILKRRQDVLEAEWKEAKARKQRPKVNSLGGYWSGYVGGRDEDVPDVATKVSRATVDKVTEAVTTIPPGFTAHPKIVRLMEQRRHMVTGAAKGEHLIDWGMGEMLCYGSLVVDGRLVRLSGQDSRRGTFSHRHAVIVDIKTGEEVLPLSSLTGDGMGEFRIYDSMLSEAAVLGFELGYSLDYPDGLVVWEAQFGDFSNGAQVIIDQFVSSAEDKWGRMAGLVLLLPHGYEGQGPEHSSARFERFLQLCAEDNMQVVYPTTPAQFFHLLRRQVLRKIRKPLVVMTPKSLLRLPEARSTVEELTDGGFQRVIDDTVEAAKVRRIVVCTGKVYYDLLAERKKRGDETVALVRVEQLYPLRDEELEKVFARYGKAKELFWVQEEPENMGGAFFMMPRLEKLRGGRALTLVSRPASASPATGSYKAHNIEQGRIVEQALAK